MKTKNQEEKFHGVAIYNPSLLSPDELKRYFVARQDLLQRILDDLVREQPGHCPQHRLLLGLRGMGKTTLLHRLALAVSEHDSLSQQWLPLTFPEEQYNIANLADLWLNCLDALGDYLERNDNKQAAEQLDQRISLLTRDDADAALIVLLEYADQQGKRLLLLFDNIDLIFDRLKQQHWVLRETLQAKSRLLIMGASSAAIEASYQYDAAFYDFFKIDELKGLSETEMRDTLLRLAEIKQNPIVAKLIEQDKARIKTLHTLTGGNPRTTVLLYNVLSQGLENGDVRSDLDGLLDQVTPLYKARFEELSTQAQQMVDALAIHWDPMSANQLAQALAWDINKVSAQVNRLQQLAIVEKQAPAEGKRHLFQIGERFFNIWYLMRASRRVRRKLIWLVHFLRLFFTADELQKHAKSRLSSGVTHQKDAEYSLALAQTLDHRPLREALEHQALGHLLNNIQSQNAIYEVLDLSGEDAELLPAAEHLQALHEIRDKLTSVLEKQAVDFDKERFCQLLLGSPKYMLEMKIGFIKQLEQLCIEPQSNDILSTLMFAFNLDKVMYCQRYGASMELFCKSIDKGEIKHSADLAGAQVAAAHYQCPELLGIAYCFAKKTSEMVSAQQIKTALKQLLQKHPHSAIWNELGNLLQGHLNRHDEAEQAYRQAIAIQPDDAPAYNNLALLLYQQQNKLEEAESLAQRAVELDPENFYTLHTLITIMVKNQHWSAAIPHFKHLLTSSSDEFLEKTWSDILHLFREIINIDKANEALQCLDETGIGQRWRPLREALAMIASGNERYLNAVAPEIRDPALKIVAQLRGED